MASRTGETSPYPVASLTDFPYNGRVMHDSTSRIAAVVLSGGRVPAALAHLCTHRALLRLGERYALAYILDALAQSPSVIATALVAPSEALDALAALPGRKAAAGDSLVENMRIGAHAVADAAPTHLLFITGDIPLVTVEGIEGFIAASLAVNAALTYPIIPREVSEQRFPGAKRTYVRLVDGTFTGGNALFTQATLLDDKQTLIQDLYAARKQPLRLAQILGWSTVVRLLFGTLALPYIEGVASRILGAPARAVITPYPEIGFDVDKATDLTAVEQALARGTS